MCAALQALPGIIKVEYDPQGDSFSLDYEPDQVKIADIFAAVVHGGKKMGQEYLPRLIS